MWTALLLALGAGLSTLIGSLLGLVMKNPGPKFVSFTVGFSAGIMIFISFGEFLSGAITTEGVGYLKAHIAFFSGMAGYFFIDLLVPHDYLGQHDHAQGQHDLHGLRRLIRWNAPVFLWHSDCPSTTFPREWLSLLPV